MSSTLFRSFPLRLAMPSIGVGLMCLMLVGSGCDPWDAFAIITKNSPPPFAPDGVTAHRDVPFVNRSERTLELDVYVPDDVDGPVPLVIYVHGGGYFMSNRHSVGSEAVVWNLLNHGMAVATMDYRFSDEAIFPAQILDVTAAICWLRANADTFDVDGTRIILAGQSAGAHLASLAAVSGNDSAIRDPECTNTSTKPLGVVDLFGPMNYDDISPEDSPLFHKIEQLFGGDLSNRSLIQSASVLDRVDEDTPPFWIAHGTADDFVPFEQSQRIANALGDARSTFVSVADAGHGGDEFLTEAMQAQVLAFVTDRLDTQVNE